MLNGLVGRKLGMSQVFTPEAKGHSRDGRRSRAVPRAQVEDGRRGRVRGRAGGLRTRAEAEARDVRHEGALQGVRRGAVSHIAGVQGGWRAPSVGSDVTCGHLRGRRADRRDRRVEGKGFQGVMKRLHYRGGPGSHGSMFNRAPGSIGASSYPSRVWKNTGLPGQMGNAFRTVKNLQVVEVRKEQNILFVKGAVPGPDGACDCAEGKVRSEEEIEVQSQRSDRISRTGGGWLSANREKGGFRGGCQDCRSEGKREGGVSTCRRSFRRDPEVRRVARRGGRNIVQPPSGDARDEDKGACLGRRKKPWKQKGTGRAGPGRSARPSGSAAGRSSGPQPRSYRSATPKKIGRLALRMALSARANEGRLRIVDSLSVQEAKTRGCRNLENPRARGAVRPFWSRPPTIPFSSGPPEISRRFRFGKRLRSTPTTSWLPSCS